MYSRSHLTTSLLVGLPMVAVVETPLGPAGTVGYARLVGTLVVLDHFLIARVRTGSWRPRRRALASPRRAFVEQGELFGAGDVGPWTRLVTHLLIVGVLLGSLLGTWPSIAMVTGVVLSVHLVADAVWDRYRDRAGA
ncbi:MAG: hypothetical protein V5A43_10540 [Haloarculaceae archaeon]